MPLSHLVKKGECLSTIAAQYGFGDWRKVYNHSDNAEFRQRRPNPNILFAGDVMAIPDPLEKQVLVAGNARHSFKLKGPKTMLHLKVMQDLGGGAATGKYEISLDGDAKVISGSIGADGVIDVEIPASARDAKLTVLHAESGQVLQAFKLQLGQLDPASEISGLQAYLHRLGFYTGPMDGEENPQVQSALENFQICYGLEATGEADEATRKKLTELCGS
jgi:hypothetical protein